MSREQDILHAVKDWLTGPAGDPCRRCGHELPHKECVAHEPTPAETEALRQSVMAQAESYKLHLLTRWKPTPGKRRK